MKLKYLLSNFNWMRVYNSPFKTIIPRLYIGKVAIGTPYFLPRIWKKVSKEKAKERTDKQWKILETKMLLDPDKFSLSYDSLYKDNLKGTMSVNKKIGFDFVGLGWKTKWDDYRFEYNPIWSFVFLKWQIALIFTPKHDMNYWECWLYYDRETIGTTRERLEQAKKGSPCVWTSTKDGVETKTDYWDLILKKKYL